MTDVKNTGIKANQLSDLDYGQVLKDSHRKRAHALDTVQVNSFIPDKYSKLVLTYIPSTCLADTASYYGYGEKQCTTIYVRDNFQGLSEKTIISLVYISPGDLSGKYFLMYDDSGSVGVWFDLDNGSTPPVTGATRDIEIDIASADSPTTLATKVASTLNSDSEFVASTLGNLAIIMSATYGNKTNTTDVDSGLLFSITDGVDSLNSKYFIIYSANDATKYYVWFNIDTLGIDPSVPLATGLEVALLSSDSKEDVAEKLKLVLDAVEDFVATRSESRVIVTNYRVGVTTEFDDATSDFLYKIDVTGVDLELVAKLLLTYDVDENVIEIEKV